jgi:serine/threonine protein kinase
MLWRDEIGALPPTRRKPGKHIPAWIGGYRVISEMTSSAMAVVVLAVTEYDEGGAIDPQYVVIKQAQPSGDHTLQDRRRDDEALLSRAQREHGALCLLSEYENFPRMLGIVGDVGSETSFSSVQEWVNGPSLHDALLCDGEDRAEQLLRLSWRLLGAVQAMYENNVVHRDLKGANILVRASDLTPIIIDFNACSAQDGRDVTGLLRRRHGPGAGIGTPGYEAPEEEDARIRGIPALDVGTGDIWRWALLTWQMFASAPTMKYVPKPRPLSRHDAEVLPEELRTAFAIAIDRADRRADAFQEVDQRFRAHRRNKLDEPAVRGTRYLMESSRRVVAALARARAPYPIAE